MAGKESLNQDITASQVPYTDLKYHIFQYITHVHFYKIVKKYIDANLDAPDNVISSNEPSPQLPK